MSNKFNKKRLAIAISAAITCALSIPVIAQEAITDEQNADEPMEQIEVRGIRRSIQTAQDLKQYADTVKDIITASDIGSLPDRSVTEALQRVPGVTIERFAASDDPKHYADEGTSVLVRGLDRVRSEINGRDSFSANPWGGLSYEDFPAELLGAVEVVKNQTADLISGGIAGTVNLVTRKPFDSDKRLIAVSAQANYADYREETAPSFSALFSDNWDTDSGKFGLLVAVSSSEFKTRGDGFGLGNFHSRGPVDTFSYDEWGTPSPGVNSGQYSNPCIPGASDWRACGAGFEDTVQYTDADQASYIPAYDGEALEGQPDGVTWYAPASYTMTSAENDRERQGLTASLQWQSTDEKITATLEHINSKASLKWREHVIASGDRGFLSWAPNTIQWFDESDDGRPLTVDDNGYVTSGVGRANEPNVPLQFRSRYNFNENTVKDTSLNVIFKPTDRITVVADYQHVDSEQIVHNNSITSLINGNQTAENAPFFLDLRGSTPTLEYLNSNASNPPDVEANTNPVLRIGSGMQQEEYNEASADTYQLDLEYKLDGAFTAIKTGLYYSEKELIVRNTEYEGWQALGTAWVAQDSYNASPQVAPELYDRIDLADHYNGQSLMGANTSFLFPRMDLVENYEQTLRDGCGTWSAVGNTMDGSGGCALPYADLNDRVFSHFAPRHISSSNTERTEFYVRADFDVEKSDILIKGNFGLRYVNYQLQSTGGINFPSTSSRGTDETGSLYQVMLNQYPSIFALASGESISSTVEGTDYSTVLPSLNLSFGLTDEVVVRFGASKGLYYPSLVDSANKMVIGLGYQQVLQNPDESRDDTTNPVVDITNIEISANARNAFLEPEESVNLDLTAEWYFAPVGSVTVGLFHKKLSNIIRNKQFATEVEVNGTSYPVSAYGPDNTGSGTIRGVEFSYTQFFDMLPGLWSGLGAQFNYTYIDQDGLEDPNTNPTQVIQYDGAGVPISDNRNSFRQFTGLPLQGYSDQNLNVVGMYEKDDISFRLAYTWRSEYLLTLRESEEFVPAYSKAQGMMDASMFYAINENVKVGLQVSNVLGTDTETQYQQNQEGTLTDAFSFTTDRRYALTVRANF
ncbi:TonB-dependent receptor [Alteromonadaceae bacterium BrNp21-10]|nr:TonB-dependent receptor [Alteromonadaceae bacterium BrNp21-10]